MSEAKCFIRSGCSIRVAPLENDAHTFFEILDILREESKAQDGSFWHNRDCLLDAYVQGRMWVQRIQETDALYENRTLRIALSPYVTDIASYCLHAFAVIGKRGGIEMIWTDAPLRRLGIARRFIRHFAVTEVSNVIASSIPFWNRIGVKIVDP